jgi:hypothetical protein
MESYKVDSVVVDTNDVPKQFNQMLFLSGVNPGNSLSPQCILYDLKDYSVKTGRHMQFFRLAHAAVTLPNGDVGVFGGYTKTGSTASCEIFNVKTLENREIPNMIENRQNPAAVLLRNGLVVIIGGHRGFTNLKCCEAFDSSTGKFYMLRGQMSQARTMHTASLLLNGNILVCGGMFQEGTTEIYDPSADSFSNGPSTTCPRQNHTATTLEDGRVLVVGGMSDSASTSTDIYDPATNSFSTGPKPLYPRSYHVACLLPDGRVWIIGGSLSTTTEIFDPKTNSFSQGVDLPQKIAFASATLC